MSGFKVFTNDWRSPIQGGAAIWDGTIPFQLPKVNLDTSDRQCGTNGGWHYCRDLAAALRIAGLWPNGWSALCVEVDPSTDAITRGDKSRASQLEIVRVLADVEIQDAIRQLSEPFGKWADHMATEQWAWFEALRRLRRRNREVERALRRALKVRDLRWSTRKYETTRATWAARDARDARDAWVARAAWAAWAAWDAWVARDARDAWAAWDARDARDAWATWAARDARDARDARAALTVNYAATNGWVDLDPQLLTTGLRDAYLNGLGVALPAAENELGWAMAKEKAGA